MQWSISLSILQLLLSVGKSRRSLSQYFLDSLMLRQSPNDGRPLRHLRIFSKHDWRNAGGGGPTGPRSTRTDANFLSIESGLAPLSSANAAKITKVTPHVLTTLGPSTTSGPGPGTRVGQLRETQSGSLLSSTSKAGGGRAWGGESTAIWEASSGMFGLFIGLLGVFL
jgi:hypothetical protein